MYEEKDDDDDDDDDEVEGEEGWETPSELLGSQDRSEDDWTAGEEEKLERIIIKDNCYLRTRKMHSLAHALRREVKSVMTKARAMLPRLCRSVRGTGWTLQDPTLVSGWAPWLASLAAPRGHGSSPPLPLLPHSLHTDSASPCPGRGRPSREARGRRKRRPGFGASCSTMTAT